DRSVALRRRAPKVDAGSPASDGHPDLDPEALRSEPVVVEYVDGVVGTRRQTDEGGPHQGPRVILEGSHLPDDALSSQPDGERRQAIAADPERCPLRHEVPLALAWNPRVGEKQRQDVRYQLAPHHQANRG